MLRQPSRAVLGIKKNIEEIDQLNTIQKWINSRYSIVQSELEANFLKVGHDARPIIQKYIDAKKRMSQIKDQIKARKRELLYGGFGLPE